MSEPFREGKNPFRVSRNASEFDSKSPMRSPRAGRTNMSSYRPKSPVQIGRSRPGARNRPQRKRFRRRLRGNVSVSSTLSSAGSPPSTGVPSPRSKNLVNHVSLPSADRLLAAITSFETALTWPETQQRIQALLKRGLQRDGDFEQRWPAVLDTLLET
jgi:hypothetical protein